MTSNNIRAQFLKGARGLLAPSVIAQGSVGILGLGGAILFTKDFL
jgi:hypothetical protein